MKQRNKQEMRVGLDYVNSLRLDPVTAGLTIVKALSPNDDDTPGVLRSRVLEALEKHAEDSGFAQSIIKVLYQGEINDDYIVLPNRGGLRRFISRGGREPGCGRFNATGELIQQKAAIIAADLKGLFPDVSRRRIERAVREALKQQQQVWYQSVLSECQAAKERDEAW